MENHSIPNSIPENKTSGSKRPKPKIESPKIQSTSAPMTITPGTTPFEKQSGFPVVGIGASAGGLEAIEQLFKSMPENSGVAFVIVQHLDPTGHSLMPEIMARFTKMPINVATQGVVIKPNSIYLMPANRDIEIHEGSLVLKEITRPSGLGLPVDLFLRSLAKEKGPNAIGIILSGTGSDGTLGIKAIKSELGTVFAQEPTSAKYDGMPRGAIDTGLVDFILKPEDMPQKLIQFVKGASANVELPYAVFENGAKEALN